ncbi:hypothetical protein SEPCBS119000_000683 [Sporothrix epigloea]|uniref:CCHC-type domain-containing protein n=1 Tax=Sporothrix epigloea TaxID=1892477 RepID=A0ABP0D6G4_9PEZI
MAPPQSPKATPSRAGTSRLLAMKFMNRLQPSDSTPTTSSPLASAPSTPFHENGTTRLSSEDEDGEQERDGERPLAKRRKVSSAGGTRAVSPTNGGTIAGGSTVAEMEATMRAAMDEEERRREAAIKRRAAELGDEHWTWNAPLPPHVAAKLAANSAAATSRTQYTVVRVGYAEIDDRTGSGTDNSNGARNDSATASGPASPAPTASTKPTIMRFNMKKAVPLCDFAKRVRLTIVLQAVGKGDEGADDDDDAAQDGKGGSRKRSRSELELKKKEPKLKHLTSLSGQGQSSNSTMKCHSCGKPGHKSAQCPQRKPSHKRR